MSLKTVLRRGSGLLEASVGDAVYVERLRPSELRARAKAERKRERREQRAAGERARLLARDESDALMLAEAERPLMLSQVKRRAPRDVVDYAAVAKDWQAHALTARLRRRGEKVPV